MCYRYFCQNIYRYFRYIYKFELPIYLSLVFDLIMKKGVGLPCTNWSGAGTALLMSPRQGETSQYEEYAWRVRLGLNLVDI